MFNKKDGGNRELYNANVSIERQLRVRNSSATVEIGSVDVLQGIKDYYGANRVSAKLQLQSDLYEVRVAASNGGSN